MIRILDRFCLGKLFRTCAHSTIYEAADLRIQKSCLCKVYEYGRLPPREAAVLHREVRLIKQLRHPLLVHYLSVLHDHVGQRYLLFMEHIKQETLAQYISRRKGLERGSHLPERKMWYIMAQFIDLLSYLHNSEFSHSPALLYVLAPHSIFIDNLDIITVNFLSLSRKLAYHECFSVRTAEYRAPELLRTGVASTKSDLWTLGCIMYELCTFKPYCLAINSMDAVQKLGKLRRKVQIPRYSNSLVSIINILLELEPECRMEAEVLAVNGIVREMIQSYKARLGTYGELSEEVPKVNEQNEIKITDNISPYIEGDSPRKVQICSAQADDDSSSNLLCTQASIDSHDPSEIITSSLNPAVNPKEHYIARYGDVLLLDFDMKRGCSILDDSLLVNNQQHLHTRDRKRRKKHDSDHPVSTTESIVQSKNQYRDQQYGSISGHNTPFAHQSSIVTGADGDGDGDRDTTSNTKIDGQDSNSAEVVSSARRHCFDSTVYSVKTPYMSQYTDNFVKNE